MKSDGKPLLLLILFLLTSLSAFCQFRMLWSKKIEELTDDIMPGSITGISHVNGGYAILFNTSKYKGLHNITYPTLSYLDDKDNLWRGILFEDSLWSQLRLVGASQASDSTLQIFGNDYTQYNNALPSPVPYQITVVMRDKAFFIKNYFPIEMSDVQGVREMNVNSYCGDGNMSSYLAIEKKQSGQQDLAILYPITDKVQNNAQFADVSHTEIPFANTNEVVLITQTTFDTNRTYPQIRILDHNLQKIRTYPDDEKEAIISRMGKSAAERIVKLEYRPAYHVGFVTRQVTTNAGQNRVAWYAFNGQQESNPAMGGDNVITVNGYPIPGNEWVVGDGDLHNGLAATNRMIASIGRNGDILSGDDLVLTVGDYMGVESSRQVIQNCLEPGEDNIKAWADNDNHLYIVANLRSESTDDEPGLYLMKWEATEEAINHTLGKAAATYGWSSEPYYSQEPVAIDDKHSFTLLGIDSSDANFALNKELKDKKIKLQTALLPAGYTYWFSGTVKIDRKDYVFTKVAVKREE